MILTEDVELIDGLPIAYIRSLNSLVLSDLHLGYEGAMTKEGVLVPKVNLKRILEMLEKAVSKTKAERMIITGDIKNDFSTVDQDEFNELYDLIQFAKERRVSPVLVKGNHDNFVERYREPFKLEVHLHQVQIGDYLFFHGEREPALGKTKPKMMVMGHEHPAIGIQNRIGRREKLRCFLFGDYKRVPLLVLPAVNYFASGTDVNIEPKGRLLSPVFKRTDIDEMHAIALGYGSTMDFGTVSKLRGVVL